MGVQELMTESSDNQMKKPATIRGLLERAALLFGERDAYRYKDADGLPCSVCFPELLAESRALGSALIASGTRGSHFAICSPNSYAWALVYLTILGGAGVAVPVSPEETPEEVRYLAEKGKITCAFVTEKTAPLFPENVRLFRLDTELSRLIETGRGLMAAGDTAWADLPEEPGRLCEILFTSGTTGAKRGVMLTEKNIMSIAASDFPYLIGTVTLSVLPFSHGFEAVCHLLAALTPGAAVIIGSSGPRFARDLADSCAESVYLVPLQAGALLTLFAPELEKAKSLKTIVCGGAPVSPEIAAAFGMHGIRLMVGYGLSECAPLVTLNVEGRTGSVGLPGPYCEVRIGADGEIEVRGENVMQGYYRDEAATAGAFTADGWLRTGDLGSLDGDGYLYISGRKKNVIVLSNGENIIPEEKEAVLIRYLPAGTDLLVREKNGLLTAVGYRQGADPMEIENDLKQASELANRSFPASGRIAAVEVRVEPFVKTALGKIRREL